MPHYPYLGRLELPNLTLPPVRSRSPTSRTSSTTTEHSSATCLSSCSAPPSFRQLTQHNVPFRALIRSRRRVLETERERSLDKQQRELIELYSIFIFQKSGGAVPQQQKPARKEGGKVDANQ